MFKIKFKVEKKTLALNFIKYLKICCQFENSRDFILYVFTLYKVEASFYVYISIYGF